MEFECEECDKDFEAPFPYGEDVVCPHCGTVWETDDEYDIDNMYAWITGKAKEQPQ